MFILILNLTCIEKRMKGIRMYRKKVLNFAYLSSCQNRRILNSLGESDPIISISLNDASFLMHGHSIQTLCSTCILEMQRGAKFFIQWTTL